MTSRTNSIETNIFRLRKRVRLLLIERGAAFGGAGGCVVAAIIVLLSTRFDSLIDYWLWAAPVLAGVVGGTLYGLLRKLDDFSVALAADKRTGMRERLSTAVAMDESAPEMGQAVVGDAVSHVSGLSSREVFRHRFGIPHASLGIALVLLAAAIFWPLVPAFQSRNRKAEVKVMKKEGAKLVKIAKEIKREAGTHKELKKLAARLQDLGRKMESGRLEKKKAMLQTRKLTKEVEKQQDELAKKNATTRSMDQAKLDMKKAGEELAKQMAMKMAAKEKIPMAEAMKQMPSDKKLAELANKQGQLSPSEQKALEEALEKYADSKNGMPIPKELGEALAKLAANKDYQKAMEIMRKLAQKLNSGKMSPMDQEMLKKQLEALAKALKNTDLDKLAKMMADSAQKLAQMSPEELEKLIKELREMQKMAELMAKAGGG